MNEYDNNSGVNPATGLPMAGGVDILGNPYGCNNSDVNLTIHNSSYGCNNGDVNLTIHNSSYGCNNSTVNPATGLPMNGSVDILGNAYGLDNRMNGSIKKNLKEKSCDDDFATQLRTVTVGSIISIIFVFMIIGFFSK